MNEVILKPGNLPKVGLMAETITPDAFAGKSINEINDMEVFCGNRKSTIGDFFKVSGEGADDAGDIRILIAGDVSNVKMIGQKMRAGEIVIRGDAGMYVGARMRGGRIDVEGSVDAFAGQKMGGGELIIKGSAGDYLGASYRGDWRGMSGGSITVGGNAGAETGLFMVGGRITIKGNCGTFAGIHMKKGLIVIEGKTPDRAGAQMTGGSIVINGDTEVLPTFKLEKEEKNVKVGEETFKGKYRVYSGDHAERNAKGKLYVR